MFIDMRKIFTIVFLLIGRLSAQDEGLLLSKYWNCRYALNGDKIDPSFGLWEPGFLDAGANPGQSIPMRKRNRIVAMNPNFPPNHPNNQWVGGPVNNWGLTLENSRTPSNDASFIANNPFYIPSIGDRQVHGRLYWSDAPTEIGKYMMLLSTELALLKKDADRYNTNNLWYIRNQNINLLLLLR